MSELIVMRLCDMHRVHPDQDDSKVCSKCGFQVGIYPSGQRILEQKPHMKIICNVCATFSEYPVVLAPGAIEEKKESKPR